MSSSSTLIVGGTDGAKAVAQRLWLVDRIGKAWGGRLELWGSSKRQVRFRESNASSRILWSSRSKVITTPGAAPATAVFARDSITESNDGRMLSHWFCSAFEGAEHLRPWRAMQCLQWLGWPLWVLIKLNHYLVQIAVKIGHFEANSVAMHQKNLNPVDISKDEKEKMNIIQPLTS